MRSLLPACIAVFVVVLGLSVPARADFAAGFAAYQRGDYVAALREWRPLAERGNARAQSNLGVMYENGRGVAQDYAQAVRWYRKAAGQGFAHAQHGLGYMYENGR
ncbi:MAG TPA: sel1 repeat family protein, partial [Rhodospirillaceae bacterium]|nr:sel1 repeat family protein [Rhodospirillaceae bacterium]